MPMNRAGIEVRICGGTGWDCDDRACVCVYVFIGSDVLWRCVTIEGLEQCRLVENCGGPRGDRFREQLRVVMADMRFHLPCEC